MNELTHEQQCALLESAVDNAMDEYFDARPSVERNRQTERIFIAGFRKACEIYNKEKQEKQ